jgi:ABC-type lipoprotein release transport system permease subunit
MAQLLDNFQAYMNLQRGGSLFNPDNGIKVKKDEMSDSKTTIYMVNVTKW